MKIRILGPKGTYSDIALDKYLENKKMNFEREYCQSILTTIKNISKGEYAILPFENTLDGFVMESLDRIIEEDLQILGQVKLDIDFAFVSNLKLEDIKNCYVQFKTYGQCLNFISSHDFIYMKTDSNVQSKELLDNNIENSSAIIPNHLIEDSYKTKILHIADSKKNETRFFIVKKGKEEIEDCSLYNASLVIFSNEDKSGLLYMILSKFHEKNINLKSILSRPSKKDLGKYNFFMECMVNKDEINNLKEVKKELEELNFVVKVLGIYNSL